MVVYSHSKGVTINSVCWVIRACFFAKGGLTEDGHVSLPEQVATFLIILAHHKKNRSLQGYCSRRLHQLPRTVWTPHGEGLRVAWEH